MADWQFNNKPGMWVEDWHSYTLTVTIWRLWQMTEFFPWESLISSQLVYVIVTSSVLWHVFRFISYFGLIEQPCTPALIEEMNSKLNCKLSCTWSCNRIKLKSVKCVIFDLTYVYNPQFVPLHLYISYEESAYNKDDTWS